MYNVGDDAISPKAFVTSHAFFSCLHHFHTIITHALGEKKDEVMREQQKKKKKIKPYI